MTVEQLLSQLASQGVRVEAKAGKWYWKTLDVLLKIISFGQLTKFMTEYTTTIGNTIATPAVWDSYPDSVKIEILSHESVHVRQYQRYGFGNAWIGIFPVGFAYLFLPFPIGLAYCRARLEWEAYAESLRLNRSLDKDFLVSQFTGPGYLWMWPFKSQVEGWYEAEVRKLDASTTNQ